MSNEDQEKMDGSPALIESEDGFIRIKFQCGVVPEVEKNGATIREVLKILENRLKGFQQSSSRVCHENYQARTKIREARFWLYERERGRKRRGVEGKHEK